MHVEFDGLFIILNNFMQIIINNETDLRQMIIDKFKKATSIFIPFLALFVLKNYPPEEKVTP